jgi:hypothetical protein
VEIEGKEGWSIREVERSYVKQAPSSVGTGSVDKM